MLREAYVVGQLQQIVKENDYEGLNNVFNLILVMRQEQAIAGEKYALSEGDKAFKLLQEKDLSE